MPQLGITLYLRAKAFNISNIRIDSISETLDSSTNTPYVTARKVAQIIGKIIWPTFVLGNTVTFKPRCLYKSILGQTSWDSHFNLLYCHFEILPFITILETKDYDIKQNTIYIMQIINYKSVF